MGTERISHLGAAESGLMLQVGLNMPQSPGGAAGGFPVAESTEDGNTGTGQGE